MAKHATSPCIRAAIAILILLTAPASSFAQRAPIAKVEITTGSGSRGIMVRPVGDGPFPAVLHLHGSGDTVANNVEFLEWFARAGYVALDVDYRASSPGFIDVGDIDTSLEYLNTSGYVKSGAVAINGFSLGARLALREATRRSVRAVSAIAARTSSGANPTILDQASRLTVPILLQHGTQDSVVPYNDSVLLATKLKGLGRSVEFFSYQGADHNTLPWNQVYEKVLTFFQTHLR